MRRRAFVAPLTALSLALLGATFTPAHAGPGTSNEKLSGLVSPLSMAVDTDGTIYVSQNFAGILTRKVLDHTPETVFATSDHSEVGAVSVHNGVVTFATTAGDAKHKGKLWRIDHDSAPTLLLNTSTYEKRHNPDGHASYGFTGLSKSCRAKKPKLLGQYQGIEDSHPYATALGDGVTYLADAGGNDILAITDDGDASTLAVLPPTKIPVTKSIRKAFKLPKCTKHATYRAEAVPTDIEVGPDGNLYVTSLPGGPEDPAMGANGRVYQVTPGGQVNVLASHILSPTGIAIAPNGTTYVSVLFGGAVYKTAIGGEPQLFQTVDFPGDVDYVGGQVYVTRTDLTNDGSDPADGAVLQFDP